MPDRFVLRIRLEGQEPVEQPLASGECVIGRAPDCDLVLNHEEVSRRHAALEMQEGSLWLTDLGSSNGTQILDMPLSPRQRTALPLNFTFTVGPYSCMVAPKGTEPSVIRAAVPRPDAPEVELAGTQMDVDFLALSEVYKLHLADFDTVTIGRATDNHAVLDHPVVSRYHAVIEKMGARFRLRDLRSANGVYVNGHRVSGDVWLKDNDEIRIGPYVFSLLDGDLRQQAESGLGISARGLHKKVGGRTNLLQNIALTIKPQELVAIVGMSGAGKSTLLNALSGYRRATQGEVVVSGLDLYRHYDLFRNEIGYVPQRDIVHMELTPESALNYAAQLRMSPDTSANERRKRVAEVLADLDLTERKNVPISRLSGGQIKRVSIGVELLTKPRLFFLDEPTSGLDPGTEYDMMKLLRRLADQGRTVLLVTHATKNVMLCDKVIFMVRGGYMAFYGAPEDSLTYFDQYRTPRERREKEMEFDDIYRILSDESRGAPAEWDQRFRAARETGLLDSPAPQQKHTASEQRTSPVGRRGISGFRQFGILSRRNLNILMQDKVSLALMLAIAPLLGLEDFVWGRGLSDPVTGDATKIIMMWFITGLTAILVGAMSSVREIVKEADIYKRERAVNLQVLPYVASKVWVGVVLAIYQATVLLFFRVLFVNPTLDGPLGYAALYITLFLATLCGYLIGLAVSAGAPNQNAAVLLIVATLIPQFLFAGGLLPLNLIPGGDIISLGVPTRWTFEAFMRTTGMGDPLAADACWALPKEERQNLTEADKAQCSCMGPNIFTQCSEFPGILSEDFYDAETEAALAQPRPIEPSQPTPYPTPTPLPAPADPQALPTYIAQMQDQGEAYADARIAQGDDYAAAMRSYGDERERWQKSRERAISSAEGMLGAIYDDFGRSFTGSLWMRWGMLSAIMGVLLIALVAFQKIKDVL